MASEPTTDEPISPKTIAERYLETFASSLHQQLAPIVLKLGKEHLLLLSKRDQKQKAVQRLIDDETAIPRSARFNFSLTVPKRTENNPEYIALRDKALAITTKCSNDLKALIIKAANLEISAIETDLQQHLTKSLRLLTQSQTIIDNTTPNYDDKVHQLVKHYLPIITTNIPMNEITFNETYRNVHSLEKFPPSATTTTTAPIIIDHSDSMFLTQISQQTQAHDPPPDDVTALKDIAEAVFVISWQKYLEQQHKNKVVLELKKLTTSYFTEQATDHAVLDIDTEPPADKLELKALIRQETKAETQTLSKQLEHLSKQIEMLTNTKNSLLRGHGGASNKQKNTPPNQPPSYYTNTTSDPQQQKLPPISRLGIRKHNSPPASLTTNRTSGGHPRFTPPPPKQPPNRVSFPPSYTNTSTSRTF